MQKFYSNTLESNYIKNLLSTNYLSNINYAAEGSYIIKDFDYIFNNNIICCTKSGFIDTNAVEEDKLIARYEIIQPYFSNENLKGINYNYFSKNKYYDSDTHYHLGNYLRGLKYLKGIDLFSLYNCYCDKTIIDLSLKYNSTDSSIQIDNIQNNKYRNITIPIKYNQKYTIAIDSLTPYIICPIIYSNYSRLYDFKYDDLQKLEQIPEYRRYEFFEKIQNNEFRLLKDYNPPADWTAENFPTEKYYRKNKNYFDDNSNIVKYRQLVHRSDFKNPYTFCIDLQEDENLKNLDIIQKLYSLEKYLYLIIQLPIGNTSSIVVLEGDFTSIPNNIFDIREVNNLTMQQQNNLMLSKNITLLHKNDGNSYAFCDRLIEYLLESPITKYDEFENDIKKVQLNLMLESEHSPNIGLWNDTIRAFSFDIYRNYLQRTVGDNTKYYYLPLNTKPSDWDNAVFPTNKYVQLQDNQYIKLDKRPGEFQSGIYFEKVLYESPKASYQKDFPEDSLGYIDKDIEYFITMPTYENIKNIMLKLINNNLRSFGILHENKFRWPSDENSIPEQINKTEYLSILEDFVNNIILTLLKLKLIVIKYDDQNYSQVENNMHNIIIQIIQDMYKPNWTTEQIDIVKSWRVFS